MTYNPLHPVIFSSITGMFDWSALDSVVALVLSGSAVYHFLVVSSSHNQLMISALLHFFFLFLSCSNQCTCFLLFHALNVGCNMFLFNSIGDYSIFVFDWNAYVIWCEKLFLCVFAWLRSKFINRLCFPSVPLVVHVGIKHIFEMTWILAVRHWCRNQLALYCWTFPSSVLTPVALSTVVLFASIFYEFHLIQLTYSVILFHKFQYLIHSVEISWRFFLGIPSCFLELFKVLSNEEKKCIAHLFCYKGRNALYSLNTGAPSVCKAGALQEPSSLGHPRKWFGGLIFCSSSKHITCWAPNLSALPFWALWIFVRQQPWMWGGQKNLRIKMLVMEIQSITTVSQKVVKVIAKTKSNIFLIISPHVWD